MSEAARSVYYGWWVVTAAFLSIVFVFGVPTVILPVLYSPIIDEFGWTRAQVTLVATMKFAAGAVVGVVFGFLVDRISIRRIVLLSAVVSGAAMIAFLAIQSLWQFYAIGLVLGLGSIGIMVSMKVLVSRWFTRRQGFAVGIALLGTSVAGSFAPVLASGLIDRVGWRGAVALMSLGIWAVALPFFLWKAKDAPGAELQDDAELAPQSVTATEALSLGDVLRTRTFWFVALAVFLIGFVDQAMTQHTVLYLDKDLGMGRAAAASGLSLIFFMSIAGKVGFGWFFDKWSVRGVSLCYLLMAVGVALAFSVTGALSLLLFAAVRGSAHGGTIVDDAVLAKHCFGPRFLGRIIGILTACGTLGFAAGPPLMGYLYDTQGSYRTAFLLLIAMSIAAGLSLFLAFPRSQEDVDRVGAGVEERKPDAAVVLE